LDGLSIASNKEFMVDAASTRMVAVSLQIMDGTLKSGTHPIKFGVEALGTDLNVSEKSIFYMPR
jgi:hypothetical protein